VIMLLFATIEKQ